MSKVVKYKKPKYYYSAGQRASQLRGALGRLLTPLGIAALSFRHPLHASLAGIKGTAHLTAAAKNPRCRNYLRGKLKEAYKGGEHIRVPKSLKGMTVDTAAALTGPAAYLGGYGYLLRRQYKKEKRLNRPVKDGGKEKKASLSRAQIQRIAKSLLR